VAIHDAAERELKPVHYVLRPGKYDSYESILWVPNRKNEAVVVQLVYSDHGDFVQVFGSIDGAAEPADAILKVRGHMLDFPCRRSMLAASFGPPRSRQTRTDFDD
jgi:hypothetical protein